MLWYMIDFILNKNLTLLVTEAATLIAHLPGVISGTDFHIRSVLTEYVLFA